MSALASFLPIVEKPFNPNDDGLSPLVYAASRNDREAYRNAIRKIIKNVLTKLEEALISDAGFWMDGRLPKHDGKKHFFLSLHFESVILHDRLRTLSDSRNWTWTDRRETEIQRFREFYSLDPRQGHLLTDPQMREELLHVVFPPVGEDNQAPGVICVTSDAYVKAHKCLDSRLFLFLLGLRPPNNNDEKLQFLNDIAELHALIPEKIRYPKPLPTAPISPEIAQLQVRSFLLTFYFSLAAKVPCQRVVVWPYQDSSFLQNWSVNDDGEPFKNEVVPKLGSLALVVLGNESMPKLPALTDDTMKALQSAGKRFVELLRMFEFDACIRVPGVAAVASDEDDRIRTACTLQDDPESLDLLKELCGPLHNKLRNLTSGDAKEDSTLREFLDKCKLVGASRLLVDLVQRLHVAAQDADIDRVTSIFMYSEPGTGKERLAKLVHLFSKRALNTTINDYWPLLLGRWSKQDEKAFQHVTESWQATHCIAANGIPLLMKDFITDNKTGSKRTITCTEAKHKVNRLFNYFALNSATLHSWELFTRGLFGEYRDDEPIVVGRLLAAHLLCGTLFLDELNTLPNKKWANVFLRLFEEPYEMEVQGREEGPLLGTNALLICASNQSKEQLVAAGFSEAVIYRLSKRYFVIPPLRERPVDIAIFVNSEIRKFNEKYQSYFIHRIDSSAMRLLCDLPWPENYRGLVGLLDHVLADRRQRKLADGMLTFDAVVEGVKRREILRSSGAERSSAQSPDD